jgi:predicted PurR-regulated permease PerM
MVGLLAVTAWLHLGVLFLTALFATLLLELLTFQGRKSLAITLFLFVIAMVLWVLVSFATQAVITLPKVARDVIPEVIDYAQKHGRELPFTDWESLKTMAIDAVVQQTRYLSSVAGFAQSAARAVVQFVIGCVVAVSVFLNSKINLDRDEPDSLYGLCSQEITARFRTFYHSFSTVMGAQVIISAINTAFTGAFITVIQLPHHIVLIGITFLCGLLPVVGNLISNTVIVGVAFTRSPELALWALLFLVVIHKLEYFLNSKIIGDRIRNPIWLTLLGLVVGELLMGITGMILAPVFLHYLKIEASRIQLREPADADAPDPEPLPSEPTPIPPSDSTRLPS